MRKATYDKVNRKYTILTALGITALTLLMLVSITGAVPFADVLNSGSNTLYTVNNAIDPETDIIYQDLALSFNPRDSVAWYNIGLDLAALNKYDEATKAYDRAIESNPLNEFAREAKRFALTKLNR